MKQYASKYMNIALDLAKKAAEMDEVPIGAIVVKDDQIVGYGYNTTESDHDPTAHAEIKAIKMASQNLSSWRLTGCDLFVTCEPCSMCAGAIVWSRIENLYIGTDDPKAGACGSVFNLVQDERLNHQVNIERDVLKEECKKLLQDFFKSLRIRGGRR